MLDINKKLEELMKDKSFFEEDEMLVAIEEEPYLVYEGERVDWPCIKYEDNKLICEKANLNEEKNLKKKYRGGAFHKIDVLNNGKKCYSFSAVIIYKINKNRNIEQIWKSEIFLKVTVQGQQVYCRFGSDDKEAIIVFLKEFEMKQNIYFVSGHSEKDDTIWDYLFSAGLTTAIVRYSNYWEKSIVRLKYNYQEDFSKEVLILGVDPLWKFQMEDFFPKEFYEYIDINELEREIIRNNVDIVFITKTCPARFSTILKVREIVGSYLEIFEINGSSFLDDLIDLNHIIIEKEHLTSFF